jgi:hypothetical protein
MRVITGKDLRLARIIYGYKRQDDLGGALGVALGTIQRYESMDEIDAKILGVYTRTAHFDIEQVIDVVAKLRSERKLRKLHEIAGRASR